MYKKTTYKKPINKNPHIKIQYKEGKILEANV
jgi:hypothetical protein